MTPHVTIHRKLGCPSEADFRILQLQVEAARNRRAFLMASVIAGVMGLLAIAGWLK